MSSDSEDLSTPANLPADTEIEQCLRRTVRDAIKAGEEITTNLARSRAEQELALEKGFFKDNDAWKKRSKDVISAAADEPESPEKPKAAPKKAGTKRKSTEAQGQRKRVKKSPVPDSNDDGLDEAFSEVKEPEEDDIPKGKAQPKSEEESALSEPPDDESEPAELKQNGKSRKQEDDDSDLSSVIDDPPPKKKRQKKSTSPTATKPKSKPKPRPSKTEKPSKPDKPAKDLAPDEEEIKRLQSWLLKCGVRKLWHRELAPYTTSKDKIMHLKAMLEEVGMTGRFSVEKARQIKEARELAAELEAAREFNEQWGHDEASGSEVEGKKKGEGQAATRRLKPKGLVDFGDSGEDSD